MVMVLVFGQLLQPDITSVGILTSLQLSGAITGVTTLTATSLA
jgi:hypothetical protein